MVKKTKNYGVWMKNEGEILILLTETLFLVVNPPAPAFRCRILHILPDPDHSVNKPQLAQVPKHSPKQSRPWVKLEDTPDNKEYLDS